MVGYGSKNGCHQDMWFKKIGLRAQNMIIIPGSIINMIGEIHTTTLMSVRLFTLITNKILI